MTLSSITFLFWFLPIFFIAYYFCKLNLRSSLILIASLFICAWGSVTELAVLVVFILLNYAFAYEVKAHPNSVALFAIADVIYLLLFKFYGIGSSFSIEGLPVGISFYTLSGISYLVDVSRGDSELCTNPLKLGAYIAMFPKLSMGPIVQYRDVDKLLDSPAPDADLVASGVIKFSIGLFKKLVIVSILSPMTSNCWADSPLSTASAWLGLLSYTLQLYYDFSAYSDMAIGLGRMLGFNFRENFMYPFQAGSVSEFWRRWHVSLGEWFRDYVYFPLGGSKGSIFKTFRNIMIVWVLSGLWHGFGYTFIVWGLLCGVVICLERLIINKLRIPKALGIIVTAAMFYFSMVIFNSADLNSAIEYYSCMFGHAEAASSGISSMYFNDMIIKIIVLCIGMTEYPARLAKRLLSKADGTSNVLGMILPCIFVLTLLIVSTIYLVSSGYTPFIYEAF